MLISVNPQVETQTPKPMHHHNPTQPKNQTNDPSNKQGKTQTASRTIQHNSTENQNR